MDEWQQVLTQYRPYLDDAVRRLRRVAWLFVLALGASFFVVGALVREVTKLFSFDNVQIVVTTPFQLFSVAVDASFLIAAGVSVPFLVWNVYAFLRPGLTSAESRAFTAVVPLSIVLFLLGAGFGGLSLYWGLQFMAAQATFFGLQNLWDVGAFLSQLAWTAALLGVLFQFPIILALGMKLGLVRSSFLKEKRPVVYAGVLFLVALLPPSDGLSLLVMALPLLAMFELTVFLYRRY